MLGRLRLPFLCAAAAVSLAAQEPPENRVPLGLNLPTTELLPQGAWALRFTHRFSTAARGNSKDAYGLDNYAYSGLGVDYAFRSVYGLSLQLYRTSDNKTFTAALQQMLFRDEGFHASFRVERFDEVIKDDAATLGVREGRVGSAIQLPLELYLGRDFVVSAVPTRLSSTATHQGPVMTVAWGTRWMVGGPHVLHGELYPRPGKVDGSFRRGWALGYSYETPGHRFTLMGTNALGTTPSQVLGGDHLGAGPRQDGNWGLGFNIARTF